MLLNEWRWRLEDCKQKLYIIFMSPDHITRKWLGTDDPPQGGEGRCPSHKANQNCESVVIFGGIMASGHGQYVPKKYKNDSFHRTFFFAIVLILKNGKRRRPVNDHTKHVSGDVVLAAKSAVR